MVADTDAAASRLPVLATGPDVRSSDFHRLADDPVWIRCRNCSTLIYEPRLADNRWVCPDCDHHTRIPSRRRLEMLLDPGSLAEHANDFGSCDVLGFVDRKPYQQRLKEARERTGENEAAIYGTAAVGGLPVAVTALDFGFLGGSMGAAVGEIVTRAAGLALANSIPLLVIAASGGARMQEGCMSLMQMARTSMALTALREQGLPSLCVVTDPTFGGVSASFVGLCDVVIAEPGALYGFAGPQVIANTLRQPLPADFQTAEYMAAHGMVDLVEPRDGLRLLLTRLLRLYHRRPALPAPRPNGTPRPAGTGGQLPAAGDHMAGVPISRTPWETVQVARDIARPTTMDYIARVFEDFQELHGDRLYGDDPAIVGGPALLDGQSVMVIGHQKGHDTTELLARNFGMAHPEGYRKAIRLMDQAERFGMPVITLVDTPGAYPGTGAEERGQAGAIADCIQRMSTLRVPAVSVITGEGGSGGALALATANRVLAFEHAVYSVISPESCSVILNGSPEKGPAMADALGITAHRLLGLGVIDGIVPEPAGGAQAAPAAAAAALGQAIANALADLSAIPREELPAHRQRRFSRFGIPDAHPEPLTTGA